MPNERTPRPIDDIIGNIEETVVNWRTFIDGRCTFGDNFRFTVTGLAKLARITDSQQLKNAISDIYHTIVIEDKYIELFDVYGIKSIEEAKIRSIFEQMGEEEMYLFIEVNRSLLSTLDLSEDIWFGLKGEERDVLNQNLELLAIAIMSMDVALVY